MLAMLHRVLNRRANLSISNFRAEALEVAVGAVAVLRIVGLAVVVFLGEAFGAGDGAVGVVGGEAGFFFDVEHLRCFGEGGGEVEEGFGEVCGEVSADGHGYWRGVFVGGRFGEGREVGVGGEEAGWDCEGGVDAFEPGDAAGGVVCFFAGLARAFGVDAGDEDVGGA